MTIFYEIFDYIKNSPNLFSAPYYIAVLLFGLFTVGWLCSTDFTDSIADAFSSDGDSSVAWYVGAGAFLAFNLGSICGWGLNNPVNVIINGMIVVFFLCPMMVSAIFEVRAVLRKKRGKE